MFSFSDVCSLFLLQLGCIVNMSSRWKKLKLRVWIRVLDSMTQDEVQTSADKLLHSEIFYEPFSYCFKPWKATSILSHEECLKANQWPIL